MRSGRLSWKALTAIAIVLVVATYFIPKSRWKDGESEKNVNIPPNQWVSHKSAEWGFEYQMPGTPTPKELNQEYEGLRIRAIGVELERQDPPALFYVMHYALPPERRKLVEDLNGFLEEMIKDIVDKRRGTILYSKPARLRDVPGRDFCFESESRGRTFRQTGRVFFRDPRIVFVSVSTTVRNGEIDFVTRFLGSFDWIEN